MSYKKFNDLQNLYEGVVSESNEIDEYTELVYNVIIAEMVYRGHSESVIRTYLENISEEQILEKVESFVSLEEYNLNEEQTDLLFSFYQEQQQLINEGLRAKAGEYGWKILNRLKGSSSKLKNRIMSALKGAGKDKSGQFMGGGKTGIDLNNLKGAKDGPGLRKRLDNLLKSTGDKVKNWRKGFDKKVTKTSDTLLGKDGKPLKTTTTVNPINKKNAAIVGGGIVGGAVLSSGGDKKGDSKNVPADKKEDDKNNAIEKQVDKYVADRKNPGGINKDLTIDKSAEGKAKYAEKAAKREAEKEPTWLGKDKGLLGKDDWLKKTRNSPAANAFGDSDEANEKRWQTQLKHRKWQQDNNRGAFKVKKEKPKTYTNKLDAFVNNKKVGDVKGTGKHKITQWQDLESYEPKGEVLGEGVVPFKTATDAVKKAAKVAGGKLGYVAKKVTDSITKSKQSKPAPDAPAKAPRSKDPRDVTSKPKPKFEEFDAYDLVLNYIMETEQASTIEEANYIMIEMDQNTIHEIVEAQKKTLGEGVKTLIGLGLLSGVPYVMSELEKRWNPVKKARDKYQDKKATEYENKSGTTKKDGYFR